MEYKAQNLLHKIPLISKATELANIESENLHPTYPADEAVRMPLRVQRWDVVLHNGTIATITLRREHLEVIVATIGFAVALMEAVFAKLLSALRAEEVLCVPCLVQSCHTFLQMKSIIQGFLYKICTNI